MLRVLTWHRFRDAEREPFSVAPKVFEEQVAWLAGQRLAVGPAELVEVVGGRAAPREGSVLVTVDDGFRDFFTAALPILRRHAVPAVLFVSVGEVEDRAGPPAGGGYGDHHVSWRELREIAESGVTVASHGWGHVSLARIPAREAARQVAAARAALRERLGVEADLFAYPFGTGGDFGPATRDAVAAAGHRWAFTSVHGCIDAGADPLELPRDKVEGGEGMWMFRRIVAGGLDAWSVADRHLWRLQSSREGAGDGSSA